MEFENLFRNFCESSPNEVTFNYLKSFRRVRVNFPVGFEAICAKVDLHQSQICGSETNVYLADQVSVRDIFSFLKKSRPNSVFTFLDLYFLIGSFQLAISLY